MDVQAWKSYCATPGVGVCVDISKMFKLTLKFLCEWLSGYLFCTGYTGIVLNFADTNFVVYC